MGVIDNPCVGCAATGRKEGGREMSPPPACLAHSTFTDGVGRAGGVVIGESKETHRARVPKEEEEVTMTATVVAENQALV